MEKRSKTNKEIFEQQYPMEVIMEFPEECIEAIGYLKALTQYFPCEKTWADNKMVELMMLVLFHANN